MLIATSLAPRAGNVLDDTARAATLHFIDRLVLESQSSGLVDPASDEYIDTAGLGVSNQMAGLLGLLVPEGAKAPANIDESTASWPTSLILSMTQRSPGLRLRIAEGHRRLSFNVSRSGGRD